MKKKVVLTGDRPTGALHIGHYVGSLKKRVEMQNSGLYDMFVMIADLQALTDNAKSPDKIRNNIMEVMLDYIAAGLELGKTRFFIQSQIPALFELPMYYANLVTVSRLERNPTIKSEIKMRGFNKSIPVGFMNYPISQAADITAVGADFVPVGADQLPMIEQAREIVNSFNKTYNTDVLVLPEAVLPDNKKSYRIVGTDGNSKMSKSLGNCIFLKDEPEEIRKKVMSMYTDPNHVSINNPGKIEGNTVFLYLDIFCENHHFEKFLPEYKNLNEFKNHYKRGGLGDVKVKSFLNEILQELLKPMRERRKEYENRKKELLEILETDTAYTIEVSNKILKRVREAIGLNYFQDKNFKENL
ncbi:MAG: tryptophan--tRNA ligase [Clostridia bacterium]|jgi:tryptophanyl-tRNA synthetase|nr:tryptophan--tRNA ligase [Clostridia bacterium]MDD3231871.1 tryptophan--tRNA ligase [Clostridia bacterium]MDD4408474.1 tryptophan--tRNA ligase [Clostridia bacterium]